MHPKLRVKQGFHPLDEEHTEMRVVVTYSQQENVEKVQDLLSQKKKEAVSLQDTIDAMARFYLEKHDPVILAERASSRTGKKASLVTPGSHRIEAYLKHLVHQRDGFRCTENDRDGNRCGATRWLHLHHEIPIFLGGTNSVENLRTLCSAHHRMIHHQAQQAGRDFAH